MVGLLNAGETTLTPSSSGFLPLAGGTVTGALEVQGGTTLGALTLTALFSDDVILSLVGSDGALNFASGVNGSFTVVSDATSVDFLTSSTYFHFQDAVQVTSEIRIFGSTTYLNSTQGFIAGNEIYHAGTAGILGKLAVASTWTADQTFSDGVKQIFGTDDDLKIHHTGGNNYFDLYSGFFAIRDSTTTRFTFGRTTGDFTATGDVKALAFNVGANQVLGAQGAAVADATDAASAITQINALLARLRTHGIIAT